MSGRVLLRRPEPSDQREIAERARQSRTLHRGLARPPATAAEFSRFLARGERPDHELHFLCRREDGAICGVLNLTEIVRGPLQSANLGYYAFVPYAGQGYMSEGIALVLSRAFGALKLHRVEASVQPSNAASIGLLVGRGFRHEGYSPRFIKIDGRWRDHLRFAIHAEDWRARRSRRRRP